MLTWLVRNSKTPECGHRQWPPWSLPSSARPRLLDLSWEIRLIQQTPGVTKAPQIHMGTGHLPSLNCRLSVHWVQPLLGEKPCLQVLLHPTSQQSQVSSPIPAGPHPEALAQSYTLREHLANAAARGGAGWPHVSGSWDPGSCVGKRRCDLLHGALACSCALSPLPAFQQFHSLQDADQTSAVCLPEPRTRPLTRPASDLCPS